MPIVAVAIWMFPKIMARTPKSSILIRFSIINHPFWGTSIFGNTHMFLEQVMRYWLYTYIKIIKSLRSYSTWCNHWNYNRLLMVQKSGYRQLILGKYPIIHRDLYIPGGCLFFLNHEQFAPENWWLDDYLLVGARPIFKGELLVSGSAYHPCLEDSGCCCIFRRGNDVLLIQIIFYYIKYFHIV